MITPIWCLHTQRLRGYCVDEINDYAKHENFANVSVRNRFSFFVWALVGFFFLSYKMIKNLITPSLQVMFSNYQATTELMVEHSKNIFSNCIYCWPSILLVYWDWEGGGGGEGEEKNIWGCLCCSLASGHADSPASVMTTSIDSIYRINKHPVLTLWKTERTLQNTTYYNCYGFTFVKFFNYNKSVLYNTVHIS